MSSRTATHSDDTTKQLWTRKVLPEKERPRPGTARFFDTEYYRIHAGSANDRLLKAFIELKIPELLTAKGPLSATAICERLKLDLTRGWKFLHLLALMGLLDQTSTDDELSSDDTVFAISSMGTHCFMDYDGGYFYRDLQYFMDECAKLDIIKTLKGEELPSMPVWPPDTPEASIHIEKWMTLSAHGAIETLIQSKAIEGGTRLLDVGGGDGTIAIAMVKQYDGLTASVFNLPASADLARTNVRENFLEDKVTVIDGNFLKDELLPSGAEMFDRIVYNRVLCDWTPKVVNLNFQKVRRALGPGGKLIINEPLLDGNEDMCIAWEFRYLHYDTFGRELFKPLQYYEKLLRDAGFSITKVSPMRDEGFYTVIEAEVSAV